MIIYNKFNLTKEENIFLAKRNIIDNIYKSAKLEGIAVTFPQTEAIYNGANIENLKSDDIKIINNLKHAWQFIFDTIEYPKVDFAFICEINKIIGENLHPNPGFLRSTPVNIGGTNWKPDFPMRPDIVDDINKINEIENPTQKALELMVYIMRKQMFLDGNKRTATLCANRILITNGAGLINVKVEDINEFTTKLLKFYETNQKQELIKFLFEKCVNGIEIKKPSDDEIIEQQNNTKMFQNFIKKNLIINETLKNIQEPQKYKEFNKNLYNFFDLINNNCSDKNIIEKIFNKLKNDIEIFVDSELTKESLDYLIFSVFKLDIAYPEGKGAFHLLNPTTEKYYKKSIYSQDITRQFRFKANKDLYDMGYKFAENPINVDNKKATLTKNGLGKDKKDDDNDNFGIN